MRSSGDIMCMCGRVHMCASVYISAGGCARMLVCARVFTFMNLYAYVHVCEYIHKNIECVFRLVFGNGFSLVIRGHYQSTTRQKKDSYCSKYT